MSLIGAFGRRGERGSVARGFRARSVLDPCTVRGCSTATFAHSARSLQSVAAKSLRLRPRRRHGD